MFLFFFGFLLENATREKDKKFFLLLLIGKILKEKRLKFMQIQWKLFLIVLNIVVENDVVDLSIE
jgi:hypothetical protein